MLHQPRPSLDPIMASCLFGAKPLSQPMLLSIGPIGTKLSQIEFEIQIFSLKKMHLKMSSGKCWPFILFGPQCVKMVNNSLAPGRCSSIFQSVIYKLITRIDFWRIPCDIALGWMPLSRPHWGLTHWDQDKMAAILLKKFSNVFS